MSDCIFGFFERWNKEIKILIKLMILLFIIVYVGYFVKLGFDFMQTRNVISFKTVLTGVAIASIGVVLFFIVHFSGGIDFDLKLIGLPLGLTIGGVLIGLIAGLIKGFIGWLIGGLIGISIITLFLKLYLKEIRELFSI